MADLLGSVATGCGHTRLTLSLGDSHAELRVSSDWMGQEPLDVRLRLQRTALGSHSGQLAIERAIDASHQDLALPPSDGRIVLEYARLDSPQPGDSEDERWTFLIWLHPHSYYDDGTQLPTEEYDQPPAKFAAVVRVLQMIEHPWKLG
jgi:hypothetical protein